MPLFDPEYKKELIDRIKKRREKGELPEIYRLNPGTGKKVTISPDQRIREAEEETPAGQEELFAEYELMEELKRRGGIE